MVTTFGAWDVLVRKFALDIADDITQDNTTILNWFYQGGMSVFEGSQSKYYQEHEQANPGFQLTSEYMRNQKRVGFDALKTAFLKQFSTTENANQLTIKTDLFINECMGSKFHSFMACQAEFTNVMNDHRKKHELSRREILEYIISLGDELVNQVQAHKVLLNDYLAQMPQNATDRNRIFQQAPNSDAAVLTNSPQSQPS